MPNTHALPCDPVLQVRDLVVEFRQQRRWRPVTHGISFTVHRGETLALVGESGSGKSVSALATMRLLPPPARATGTVLLGDEELDILRAPRRTMLDIRGRRAAFIFQEPMTALNPVHTVGKQVAHAVLAHQPMGSQPLRERVIELLQTVRLPDAGLTADCFPHQLSGGQRQRVMIAMAIANDPEILIADEPTTALDVTVQAEILRLIVQLQDRLGMALLIITHDMGVVAEMADRVVVMRDGHVIEEAPVQELFDTPQEEYTSTLLAAVPRLGTAAQPEEHTPVSVTAEPSPPPLIVEGLQVDYGERRKAFRAVDDVSFSVGRGEVLGLVGESGSGKSTIARALIGLTPAAGGSISVLGSEVVGTKGRQMREIRRNMGIVFQDPASSLNPRTRIGDCIVEPLRLHGIEKDRHVLRVKAEGLLESVGLPSEWVSRYPHQLSGGQRQRVSIARALCLEPKILIADEPTSALDVSVQATVLRLLSDLQASHGFACVFVSHDLAVVESLANEIVVLRQGRVVESGRCREVFSSPKAEYTRVLLDSVPVPDPSAGRLRSPR